MRLTSFLCFILVMMLGWMQLYSRAREIFNGTSEIKAEIGHLKSTTAHERIAMALEREQFLEFRQNVATLMPDVLKSKGLGEEGYPYRSLASSISRSEAELVRQTIAKTLFERAKDNFRQEKFPKAIHGFHQIIDHFGFTPYVADSYFLLAESHFKQNELEACTGVIQEMVELFPHHELTGFALVRLGRIYQVQNRNEEAIEIFKTVMRSFPQRDVAAQAKASLKGIDL